MKTPYLDASILLHEKASKINMLSKAGKASLIEFKKIKQALNIASVSQLLIAYEEYKHSNLNNLNDGYEDVVKRFAAIYCG